MLSTENKLLLESVYQTARTGMDAARLVIGKVDNPALTADLESQYKSYHTIAAEAGTKLAKREAIAKEPGNITRLLTWGNIQLNTLTDHSSPHVAGVMMAGSTQGIKETAKQLKDNESAGPEAKGLCQKLITQEQDNIERMKKYL